MTASDSPTQTSGATPTRRIALALGGAMSLTEGWIAEAEADALLAALLAELPWRQTTIRMLGREVLEPRLTAYLGDPSAVYTYSGTLHVPAPWVAPLSALRARLASELGLGFDSVLCNLYRDGRDSMGLHADAEPELGPDPVLASISLGAARRFVVVPRKKRDRSVDPGLDLALCHGSLLVMEAGMQRAYKHGVPKTSAPVGPRVNLTFRPVVAA